MSPRQKKFTPTYKRSTYTQTQHLYTLTRIMIGSNTTLGNQVSYKEGYNEGVEDVFIAFSGMLDTINNADTYQLLHRVYRELSNKFPRLDPYEE